MMTDEEPKTPITQRLGSPKLTPSPRNSSVQPESFSNDDDDDENTSDSASDDEDTEHPNVCQTVDQLRQRLSSTNAKPESHASDKPPKQNGSGKSSGINLSLIIVSLTLVGIACYAYHARWGTENSLPAVDDRLALEIKRLERIRYFKSNMTDIKNRFPSQERRTWGDMESGMIDLINQSQKLSITVLFSNETKELSCLAKSLGRASSKALNSDESLELYPHDLDYDDWGLVIPHLEPKIIAKKAVIIHDLLNINPWAIQAFHTICDRHNPLVEGAALIMTIILPGSVAEFDQPDIFIEEELTKRYSEKVPKEKIQPLVTRLIDGPVIPIKSEIRLFGCHENRK